MPYKIFAVKKNGEVVGYKVGKKDRSIMDNGRRYLSNKPLSKKKAVAQLRAVGISESMSSPVPIKENKLVAPPKVPLIFLAFIPCFISIVTG